jgi:hypothetical protein
MNVLLHRFCEVILRQAVLLLKLPARRALASRVSKRAFGTLF